MTLSLGPWDWGFVLWFLLVTVGVGLYYSRRASKNLSEYFVSGRSLPWWALGTSMVATTFAADTPIVVSQFVVERGIAKNWLWWSFAVGATLTVFVFSRWWRRAGVVTEIELVALRYDGASARWLRGFKAVYLGIVANSIVIGWVMKAMMAVLERIFGASAIWAMAGLMVLTFAYATASGLWGVVAADVLQFAMALIGAVLLAVLAVSEVGGLSALSARVEELGAASGHDFLALVPSPEDAFFGVVCVLVLVNWWAVYYPGSEPGGGGYVAQRMLSARDERHARAGTLWFTLAHYVIRPWPWILVGLAALALEPRFLDPETHGDAFRPDRAYPSMLRLLPVGALGLVVASFLAAFMSTVTTQLNLAASYLVNDLWRPLRPAGPAGGRADVRVARLAVALITALGCLVAWILSTAGEGWTVIMELTGGIGLVLILRWIWWRVNAVSEIVAIVASAAAFGLCRIPWVATQILAQAGGDEALAGSFRLLITVGLTTLSWVTVTLATRPVEAAHLAAFYRRVRPGGFWAPVASATGLAPSPLRRDLLLWGASTALVLGTLLGLGSALLLRGTAAALFLTVAAAGGLATWWGLRRERAEATGV